MRLYSKALIGGVIAVAACGCSQTESPAIPTLDIAANINCADKGTLNDIFDLKGIFKPELTDSTLLSYANIRGVYEDHIYVQEDNRLMVFNMADGKCVSSIDRTGQGPEDYVMLYFAYPSPENGDWVAWDIREKKIVRYKPNGQFVGAYPADIECICPDGKNRWAGQKNVIEGENQMIYIYDDNFTLTDSIETPLQRYFMTVNRIYPFNGQPVLPAADTLYMVTPQNKFVPAIAFSLGSYLSPNYKENEFDKMIAERNKYIAYDFIGEGELAGIVYQFNDRMTLQFYSLADNAMVFSDSTPKTEFFEGFPFSTDSKTYKVAPIMAQQPADNTFFFQVVPELTDDEESNPTILMLKLKPQYCTTD